MAVMMRNTDCNLKRNFFAREVPVFELRDNRGMLLVSGTPRQWLSLINTVLGELETLAGEDTQWSD